MHLIDWLLAHQICNQLICIHRVEQRRAVGHDGDDERNGMSQAGLFHPRRQGSGESQTLCNTMARQTESACKRVNICNSSMWPVAFLKSHPYGRAAHPRAAFQSWIKKKKHGNAKPVRSQRARRCMKRRQWRWGGEKRTGEEEEGRR